MERNCSLDEISDGKLYGLHDMVKVGCNDCKGCSACCQDMGNTIVLDPYDCVQLMRNQQCTFEELLVDRIELNIVDHVILPNLRMSESLNQCNFLNEEGRCSIHSSRPGLCRIFPLGRFYQDNSFTYILQVKECVKETKTKIKVSKWIDIENVRENQKFINDWHYFLKEIQGIMEEEQEEENRKKLMMYILHTFYISPYTDPENFYQEFNTRLEKTKRALGLR